MRIAILDDERRILRFEEIVTADYAPPEPWAERRDHWAVGGTVTTGGEYTPPAMTDHDRLLIKHEAARRIEAVMPTWRVVREWSGGEPVPEEAKASAARIRKSSNRLEAMDHLPHDWVDDKYWS